MQIDHIAGRYLLFEPRIFDAASKDAQSEVRTTQAAVRADAGVTRRALQAKMHEFTEAAMAKLLA